MQAGGQEFDSPHLHHHVAASVISLAATFLQKSPCAHSAAAPLSRKILRFFTSLRLRRFFILKPLWLARFVYTKHGFTLSAAAPFSQKTYRFFGSPILAATFLQKSPCAHSAAAPLSRKILRFFTSLRLRRFFILKPLWLARFVYTKHGFTCQAAAASE